MAFKCKVQRLLSIKFTHESNATLGQSTVVFRTVNFYVQVLGLYCVGLYICLCSDVYILEEMPEFQGV